MGIRMLHRRKAHARVHATAAAGTRAEPGTAPWRRPRPALAPRAATARVPRTPAAPFLRTAARILHTAATRLRRPDPDRLVRARLLPLVLRTARRVDARRLRAAAAHARQVLALRVLGRLLRPRRIRRIPVLVATAPPFTDRPDRPAAH
ncbi:hypothetical protein QA943_11890 [Streptomyces sp. B21-097]|uniref:hypothetical protein n=1 Tax=Streptomyces sp. B21-097 TaxID=3039414 RepID=UPI002FF0FD04